MNFIFRIFAESAIQIRYGRARCLKGTIMRRPLGEIASLASELGVENGEIWIDSTGKASFSREFPKEYHQRLRNVLASA